MLHIILKFVSLLWFIIKNRVTDRKPFYPLKGRSVGGSVRRVWLEYLWLKKTLASGWLLLAAKSFCARLFGTWFWLNSIHPWPFLPSSSSTFKNHHTLFTLEINDNSTNNGDRGATDKKDDMFNETDRKIEWRFCRFTGRNHSDYFWFLGKKRPGSPRGLLHTLQDSHKRLQFVEGVEFRESHH